MDDTTKDKTTTAENQTEPDATLNGPDPYDLAQLRIGSAVAPEHVAKRRVRITVKKPSGEDVVTVHPEIGPVEIYTLRDSHDKTAGLSGVEYLVAEPVVAEYGYAKQFRKKLAFPAVTKYGHAFLWTIACADESGRRSGSATTQEALAWAGRQRPGGKVVWQMLEWDSEDSAYVSIQKALRQQPSWPEGLNKISDWLRLAYPAGRFLKLPLSDDQKKLLHDLLALDDDSEE
jgi:hypothetical protein